MIDTILSMDSTDWGHLIGFIVCSAFVIGVGLIWRDDQRDGGDRDDLIS